jgi:hypothetical protein
MPAPNRNSARPVSSFGQLADELDLDDAKFWSPSLLAGIGALKAETSASAIDGAVSTLSSVPISPAS